MCHSSLPSPVEHERLWPRVVVKDPFIHDGLVERLEVFTARKISSTDDVIRNMVAWSRIICSMRRPERMATSSGANGERPSAIKSALMKMGHPASCGRYSHAKVVLPAPLGPATIKILRLPSSIVYTVLGPRAGYPKEGRRLNSKRRQLVRRSYKFAPRALGKSRATCISTTSRRSSGSKLLDHARTVSAEVGKAKAELEYERYQGLQDAKPRAIDAAFEATAKQLKKPGRARTNKGRGKG